MPKILIADDESSIRTILAKAMEKQGFEVCVARNGLEALEILKTENIDVAILDIRMPELTGLDILTHQNEFASAPSLFVITAQDTMENAIEAMKHGATDYLTKPFDLNEVSLLVSRALENRQMANELSVLKKELSQRSESQFALIGKSKNIKEIYKVIGRVANQDVTVLIHGESGTGKELVARAIHFQGSRTLYPFVAVNCTAIPDNLLESELFGYKKGAYTGAMTDKEGYFERAHLGTLFLDEIGDMPLSLQGKLLRVLQEKEIQRLGDTRSIPVNVRIIAATNQKLQERIKKGLFREDLFYRLNVVPLSLPPLRDRSGDIRLLAEFFLNKCAKEFDLPAKKLSCEAIDYLEGRPWMGNIRELENLLKRVFVLSRSTVLKKEDFVYESDQQNLPVPLSADITFLEDFLVTALKTFFDGMAVNSTKNLYDKFIPLMEKPLITLALAKTQGNQLKAADLLGINRNTLRKKIRELKIDRRKNRE